MIKEKKFYVYVHRRKTDGSIFYVGKGSGKRKGQTCSRNPHWNATKEKHGFTHEILALFNHEVCAFSFEVALIKRYGIDNLVNMTYGGEGKSGSKHSDETKLKMSKAHLGVKKTESHKKNMSTARSGIRLSENHKYKLSESHKGYKHSIETRLRMSNSQTGLKKEFKETLYAKSIRKFSHLDGSVFIGKNNEFIKLYNLSNQLLFKLISGKIKSHRGWKYDYFIS